MTIGSEIRVDKAPYVLQINKEKYWLLSSLINELCSRVTNFALFRILAITLKSNKKFENYLLSLLWQHN